MTRTFAELCSQKISPEQMRKVNEVEVKIEISSDQFPERMVKMSQVGTKFGLKIRKNAKITLRFDGKMS